MVGGALREVDNNIITQALNPPMQKHRQTINRGRVIEGFPRDGALCHRLGEQMRLGQTIMLLIGPFSRAALV